MQHFSFGLRKRAFILTLTAIAVAFLPMFATAQTQWNPRSELSLKFKYETSLKHGEAPIYLGTIGYSHRLGQHFSLGMNIGAGAESSVFVATTDINAAYHITAGPICPYIAMRGGLLTAIADNGAGGTTLVGPSVGVQIPVARCCALDLGIEYTRYGLNSDGSDILGLKAGLCFALGRSAKTNVTGTEDNDETSHTGKFSGGVEVEAFTSSATTIGNEMRGMYGVRGYALWSVFTPNLHLGIAASLGKSLYTQQFYFGSPEKESALRYALMARVRYKIAEATMANRLYPFVQADAGYAYNGVHSQFAVEPAIGLSLKTTSAQTVDLSVGFLPKVYFQNGEKTEDGCLRIALGYTF